jgi:hypothetical protein
MNPRAPGAPWPTAKGVYVAYALIAFVVGARVAHSLQWRSK